jgi:hypothetical protein
MKTKDETARSEVADGLLYAHSRANSNTAKLLEVSSFAYAAIELLAERGLIDIEYLRIGFSRRRKAKANPK